MQIAGRHYKTSILDVLKSPTLLSHYEAFVKSRNAPETIGFMHDYMVLRRNPLQLYWDYIHTNSQKAVNISGELRKRMNDAIHEPKTAEVDTLQKGLAFASVEVLRVMDANFEEAFQTSEQARDFAYATIRTDESLVAEALGIRIMASRADLKTALIEYALGDTCAGRAALNDALCEDHPKRQPPSTKRLDDCEELVLNML
ncbi:hypothetical protein [uncultured Tateyamaria sp.]|uniref:hypothetical protein n=1 Tax=uncultured Tateyamaria sp. TaxID=455651 RepID=UPI0026372246|nr:hypothetical protein [uncultured Tateyamaria sp.]